MRKTQTTPTRGQPVFECPAFCDLADCCLSGSSVHGILQAGILKIAAIHFSREPSRPKDQIRISGISYIGRRVLYHCAKALHHSKEQGR